MTPTSNRDKVYVLKRGPGFAPALDFEAKHQRLRTAVNSWLLRKIVANAVKQALRSTTCSSAEAVRGLTEACLQGNEKEVNMSTDDRDILEILQEELDFIESGGYGRSPRTPWKSRSAFQDSLTCVNYALPEKEHSCNECHLIDFVPAKASGEAVPCHHIPLNDAADTLDQLESEDDQYKLEESLKTWLRARIKEIETARARLSAVD